MRNDKLDIMEIYDNIHFQNREFYLSYIKTWVPQRGEAMDIIFNKLGTFSMDRLEL